MGAKTEETQHEKATFPEEMVHSNQGNASARQL